VQPIEVLAVPRSAVLSDQQGSYVYVVGADNKAEQRRVQLGQSTSTIAAVVGGLKEGDHVVVEGLQRVRPGQPVSPGPASPQVQAAMQGAGQGGGEQGQAQPATAGASQGAPAPTGAPPGPAATGASDQKSGTTANAPATVAPPAGQASSGTVGGAMPAPSGNPSARH
jgi:membrane fusion protein (multidrug efflux system)